jgi:hypothetical protein
MMYNFSLKVKFYKNTTSNKIGILFLLMYCDTKLWDHTQNSENILQIQVVLSGFINNSKQ